MTLGEKIKKLRTEKGISQEELGRLMRHQFYQTLYTEHTFVYKFQHGNQ